MMVENFPELESGTVEMDSMVNKPSGNYTNIVVLRELASHGIFTTDGENIDTAPVSVGNYSYTPALMFMRKQTGSDRRTAKELQRNLRFFEEEDHTCTMDPNEMCQKCVECVLYGNAAGSDNGNASTQSRVLYDTAYSIRDSIVVTEEKFQAAFNDNYMEGENPQPHASEFVKPGTLFPCTITLKDATPAEVAFVLAVTQRNGRYGASTTRTGKVENHVLGVYCGSNEGPSNLQLAREVITGLEMEDVTTHEDPLPVSDVKECIKSVYNDTQLLSVDDVDGLLDFTQTSEFKDLLGDQLVASRKFYESNT